MRYGWKSDLAVYILLTAHVGVCLGVVCRFRVLCMLTAQCVCVWLLCVNSGLFLCLLHRVSVFGCCV